jgi:hypothetical protein
MSINTETYLAELVQNQEVMRGRICGIETDGTLVVSSQMDSDDLCKCDLLHTGGNSGIELEVGALVLYLASNDQNTNGCVLGKIGKYKPNSKSEKSVSNDTQEINVKSIQIVAQDNLILRCGEGSLIISKDGSIILRGSKILSRAKGVNKVKGAAVQIN